MLIENTDKGSVITWDFDVMKHDVMFCVFRTVEAVKRKGGSTSGVAKEKKEELGSFNNMGTSGDPEHYTGVRLFSEIAMSIICNKESAAAGQRGRSISAPRLRLSAMMEKAFRVPMSLSR